MKMRITRFSIHQTSRIVALLSGLLGLLAIPVGIKFYLDYPETNLGEAILIWLTPLWNAGLGYISTALACWLYNLLADKVGGVEFEIDELRSPKPIIKRTNLTATKIKTVDPGEIVCSNCQRKQWFGHTECELCGASFEKD